MNTGALRFTVWRERLVVHALFVFYDGNETERITLK